MKEKVIFALKCFAVILPFIAISIYTPLRFGDFIDDEMNLYIWNKNARHTHHQKMKNLIIGDSAAKAGYLPEIISANSLNIALGGNSPVETYYVLKDWLKHNEPPENVFISYIDWHMSRADWFWDMSMRSNTFSFADKISMYKAFLKYKEKEVLKNGSFSDFLCYLFYLPKKYVHSIKKGYFERRYIENKKEYEINTVKSGAYFKLNVPPESKKIHYDAFYTEKIYVDYYKKIIDLCLKNNIKVYLIKQPAAPAWVSYGEGYAASFNDFYDKLKREFPGIIVYRFDKFYPDEFVYDNFHLNKYGALKFSVELIEKFPEIHDNLMTPSRLKALNYGFYSNDKLEQILYGAYAAPYTLVIYDELSGFSGIIEAAKKDFGSDFPFSVQKNGSIYVISKSGYNAFEGTEKYNDKLKIRLKNGDSYVWNPFKIKAISVVVINNHNNDILFEKKFYRNNGKYLPLPDKIPE